MVDKAFYLWKSRHVVNKDKKLHQKSFEKNLKKFLTNKKR